MLLQAAPLLCVSRLLLIYLLRSLTSTCAMGDMPLSKRPTILNVSLLSASTRYLPFLSHEISSTDRSDVGIGVSISAAKNIS